LRNLRSPPSGRVFAEELMRYLARPGQNWQMTAILGIPGEPHDNQQRCSFCKKSWLRVKSLIAGPDSVFICGDCVELCVEMLSEPYERP